MPGDNPARPAVMSLEGLFAHYDALINDALIVDGVVSPALEMEHHMLQSSGSLPGPELRSPDAQARVLADRVALLRRLHHQRSQLALASDLGVTLSGSPHDDDLTFSVAHRLVGVADPKLTIVLFSGGEPERKDTEQHEYMVQVSDQLKLGQLRAQTAEEIPSDVELLAVAASHLTTAENAVVTGIRLARALTPGAVVVADFPGDPWHWSAGHDGHRTGVTCPITELVASLATGGVLPDAIVARDSHPNRTLTDVVPAFHGADLGDSADWLGDGTGWDKLLAVQPLPASVEPPISVEPPPPAPGADQRRWWQVWPARLGGSGRLRP